jgi:beta-galactosidase
MVRLNDRAIQIHGYAQRTTNEWPAVGMSVPAWLSDYSNGLALDGNANLIRWMHITPWKQDVESLDRIGLMQAMPAGDQESEPKGRQWEQRLAVMRDAIIYNRNNPSIIFYEAGNHGVSATHMQQMRELRDKYDPYGGRASGSREMLSSELQKVAEYGGEMLFINKSARMPMWAMEYSRDEAPRKYWDELTPPFHKNGDGPLHAGADARAYNRNQDTFAIEDTVRWNEYYRARPGTGARVNAGGVNIIFSDSNTHHRGAENYRRSGEVDAMRIPKDAFFAHQVMWDGWVDVDHTRAHILGHWNYPAGTVKPVSVVSSAAKVELLLNGKSLGAGRRSDGFLFTFDNVNWLPGELKAVGYDAAGKQVCETMLATVGAAVALRLTPIVSPVGLHANGADLALVQVEAVDAKGRRNPLALNLVRFEMAGPAEWRGGIAQGPNNYVLARTLPVEGGVNRVLLRSGTVPGKIVLRATADGLAPAELTLESKPAAPAPGGLSAVLPDAGLPLRLERGPTPSTPSFKVSRASVPVKAVEASSNAGDAGKSVDDDESTAWTSATGDNHPAITYHLAHPATLTEMTLRLVGWRSRSYPLRISVDGEEVFSGRTERSNGYANVQLKPRLGSAVHIELLDAARDRDDDKLVEVANQKNTDTGTGKTATTALAIVEADFYQAP